MQRIVKVEETLSWAYQNGYVFAKPAADDYAKAIGCAYRIHDGGSYADWLVFFDTEEAAVKAEEGSRFTYRRPEPV